MFSVLLDGEFVFFDGLLFVLVLVGLGICLFGVYLYVFFCVVCCGYCDFNIYMVFELGGGVS